jgi:DNA ligase-1
MIEKPLLAETIEDIESLKFPLLASPKLDGIRAMVVDGKLLSRKFKPIPNTVLREKLESILPNGIDGEIMVDGATFNEIQSAVMTIKNEDIAGIKFHAFDYVISDPTKPYVDRLKDLEAWYAEQNTDMVQIVRHRLVLNVQQLLDFETECIAQNYEGVMVRSLEGRYKFGRSTLKEGILLKLKKFQDAEAKVIGFVEKMTNTNEKKKDELGYSKRSSAKAGKVPSNTLGALVVSFEGATFEIGSGFDDELRKEIWTNQEKYVNQQVTFKYQPSGMKDLPRFPVFLGFRYDI